MKEKKLVFPVTKGCNLRISIGCGKNKKTLPEGRKWGQSFCGNVAKSMQREKKKVSIPTRRGDILMLQRKTPCEASKQDIKKDFASGESKKGKNFERQRRVCRHKRSTLEWGGIRREREPATGNKLEDPN